MCIEAAGTPLFIPANRRLQWPPAILCFKCLLFAERGVHTSAMGLDYPLGQKVVDTQAKIGSHEKCIHLYPTYEAAINHTNGNDLHIVAMVVPITNYWTNADTLSNGPTCWHADMCLPIWCYTCSEGAAKPTLAPIPAHIAEQLEVKARMAKMKEAIRPQRKQLG